MKTLRLYQLDAFADRLFAGNPAAVVPLDAMLDDTLMQAIALENNLAETAFFAPEGEGFRLRWFTPAAEVPLCGHATLASARVVFDHLRPAAKRVDFETLSGRLTVTREDGSDLLSMDFPAVPSQAAPPPAGFEAMLGGGPIGACLASARNLIAVYDRAKTVRDLAPDLGAIAKLDKQGVIVTAPGDAGFDCVSRYFAPRVGVPEDPVTGSAHCALIPYWAGRLGQRDIRAFQASARGGAVLGRHMENGRVRLTGRCQPYLEGTIRV
ncbi:MAG: PhzF family phenazine biosynthesis protein [Alphaproteobacteria bacterium]|nr:PhzF family phenazine biosynthesis protein [Alphaproteobacteria bacterium]